MADDNATLADARKLVDILEMHALPLQTVFTTFAQAFTQDRHAVAVSFMRGILDVAHASPCLLDLLPQVLTTYFLLRYVGQEATQGPRRGVVSSAIKAAQHHELQRLEGLLRDDARITESLKYKQSAPTGAKKQTAKDASDIDSGRAHLLLKVVLFRQLLGQPNPASVADLFKIERATLEAEADTWSTPPTKPALIEAISELKSSADAEIASALGGAVNRSIATAIIDEEYRSTAATLALDGKRVHVSPPAQRLPPTFLPPLAHEMRFVCAPSASTAFVLDAVAPTAEWKAATTVLTQARSTVLTAAQHQSLVSAGPKCIVHAGLSIPAFLEISEKNPHTAAYLIQALCPAETYLDALISQPGAAGCQRTEIMLASRKQLQPHQLTAYIKNMATAIRAQHAQKPVQQELVSNFAVTLHQLVGSPTSLAKQDADIVVPLFTEFAASVTDVNSLWAAILKT